MRGKGDTKKMKRNWSLEKKRDGGEMRKRRIKELNFEIRKLYKSMMMKRKGRNKEKRTWRRKRWGTRAKGVREEGKRSRKVVVKERRCGGNR